MKELLSKLPPSRKSPSKSWLPILLLLPLCFAGPAPAKNLKIALLMAATNENHYGEPKPSEILSASASAFFDSKRFEVIEREQLAKIFDERELSDFINGQPGDLSNLHGVDMLGLITFSKETGTSLHEGGAQQERIFIDVRLTDVKTGQMVGSVDSRRPSVAIEPTTPHLAGRLLLENIRTAFPPEGSVVKVLGEFAVVSLGSTEGLKEGDHLQVLAAGDVFFDDEGNSLSSLEEVIAELKVIQVSARLSKCEIKRNKKNKDLSMISIGDRVRLHTKSQDWMNGVEKALPWAKKLLGKALQ